MIKSQYSIIIICFVNTILLLLPMYTCACTYHFGRDIVLANPDEYRMPRIRNYNELY